MPQETPPELLHAARTAARRVEKLLLEMLLAKHLGEVAVVVSWGQLEPLKRIVERDAAVKVGRGGMSRVTGSE